MLHSEGKSHKDSCLIISLYCVYQRGGVSAQGYNGRARSSSPVKFGQVSDLRSTPSAALLRTGNAEQEVAVTAVAVAVM